MQLFWVDYTIKNNFIVVEDIELFNQVKNVLRIRVGDVFCLQKNEKDDIIRTFVKLDSFSKNSFVVEVLKNEIKNSVEMSKSTTMFVAMPNKWTKAELIVQKLTEIGIEKIVFWVAERSVIKQSNNNKMDRLYKICKEASEQSWGWFLPQIYFVANLNDLDIKSRSNVTIFDKKENQTDHIPKSLCHKSGIVGPEGGLTQKDYKYFFDYDITQLGSNVLRMETACIIGGWMISDN